eukprot:208306-Prymnesium_polylepis.4
MQSALVAGAVARSHSAARCSACAEEMARVRRQVRRGDGASQQRAARAESDALLEADVRDELAGRPT